MADSKKRKSPPSQDTSSNKKSKTKKQWRPGRSTAGHGQIIEPGDAGIWATCNRGREARCVGELRVLFQEYVEMLYGHTGAVEGNEANDEVDIEDEIKDEVNEMKEPNEKPLFEHVRLDTPCVLFFRTRHPIEPVEFVHTICKDATHSAKKRTRHVLRLTPATLMGRANENALGEIAKSVLGPHFHSAEGQPKKFAIRPTLRNHQNILTRDNVIKQIAEAVGSKHVVDLKNYDLLILVDVYKNICGMSVVGNDFETPLKRYNLAELGDEPGETHTGE